MWLKLCHAIKSTLNKYSKILLNPCIYQPVLKVDKLPVACTVTVFDGCVTLFLLFSAWIAFLHDRFGRRSMRTRVDACEYTIRMFGSSSWMLKMNKIRRQLNCGVALVALATNLCRLSHRTLVKLNPNCKTAQCLCVHVLHLCACVHVQTARIQSTIVHISKVAGCLWL